jgi:adenosylcobinamide-GDP ribazoletransferase
MRRLELFWLALGFYTRLPCPQHLDYSRLPSAAICLPLIGWLIGTISGLGFYLADWVWGQPVAVILAISLGILATGAFHEDGFADVCDGFGGGYGKDRILLIMKDSRIGAYGALGLLLLMALKISVLVELPAQALPGLLVAGHSISRLPPLLIMAQYDYARSDTAKSYGATVKPNKPVLVFAAITALLPLLLLPAECSLAIVPILIGQWQLGGYFYRHIGGYTGDCLGASQQVAEVVFYLSVAALWTSI